MNCFSSYVKSGLIILFIKLAEEAGPVAGVAHGAGGACLDKDNVAIAVFPYGANLDVVARGFSFVPEFLAAAAEEPDIGAGHG